MTKPVVKEFKRASLSLIIAFCTFHCAHTNAAELTIVPSLYLAHTYDDNVRLSPSGSEQSDHITQIKPSVTLDAISKNTRLDLSYQLDSVIYKENTSSNDIYHHASLVTNSIVSKDRLFLDTNFLYSQTNLSNSDAISLDNLAITNNRTDVFDYTVRPYFISPIGRLNELRVSYTYSGRDFENNISSPDYTRRLATININNHKAYNRVIWDVNYSNSDTEFDANSTVEFEDANLELKYLMSSKSYLKTVFGEEDNNYPYDPASERPEGSYWKAGLGWRPSRRTLVEATAGDRFFGTTYEFLLNHRTKFSNWNFTYNEALKTQNTDESTLISSIIAQSALGNLSDVSLYDLNSVFNTEVYLSKKYQFSVNWKTRKSELTIAAVDEKREYQILKDTDSTKRLRAVWSWNFLNNNFLNLRETWIEQSFRSSPRVDTVFDSVIEFERKIHRTLSGRIAFRTLERKSNVPTKEYRRNLISIIVDMQF